MTRETKIGLLVGLAFIILFAFILSEKGTTRHDQFTTPPIASYKPVVELIPPTAPPANHLTQGESQESPERLTMSDPGLKISDQPTEQEATRQETPRPVETVTPPAQEIAPNLKPLLPAQPTRAVSQIPAATIEETSAEPEISTGQARAATKTPAKSTPLKTHTIQQGETLASICRQYYPGRAYTMLKEVIELNKITRPERLMVGQVIQLPVDPTQSPAQATVAQQTEKPSSLEASGLLVPVDQPALSAMTNPRSVSVKPVQTYVVQEKDTLSKIARQFYGDERAWPKIYEFNKNILTGPHSIKSGIELRIPPLSSTNAQGLASGPNVD